MFYDRINLDQRIRSDHILRQIAQHLDFDFIYEVCVADSKYGTIENYLSCHDREVKSHFASLELGQRGSGRQAGIIPKESFIYDAATDCFICPAGERLSRRVGAQRRQWEYTAPPKSCSRCALQPQFNLDKEGIPRTYKERAENFLESTGCFGI